MSSRRTTPLEYPKLQSHQCSLETRLKNLGLVPFFQTLDRQSLHKINVLFRAHHVRQNDVIYRQHDKAAYLRILVFGAVCLLHHTETGKDILIDLLQPGEYFGTLPLLGDDHYSETAYAHTDCCILVINGTDFEQILHFHPDIAIALIGINAHRLKKARDTIRHLASSPVEKRIAATLLSLAQKFGIEKDDELLVQLPLSRKNLADITGTTTETASRVMSQFQDDRIIKTGRKWVSIINLDALKHVSEH